MPIAPNRIALPKGAVFEIAPGGGLVEFLSNGMPPIEDKAPACAAPLVGIPLVCPSEEIA
ncbi:MAG: hypothetical protein ABSD11_13805 [Methylocella sp.]|jgi:hypothetical protein